MTFKEAIDKIFLHQEEEDRNPGAYVSYDGLGAMVDILRELEETYAPKIKMKKNEDEMLKKMKRTPQIGVGIVDYSGPEPKVLLSNESNLVDAWLHPELIEVSDD